MGALKLYYDLVGICDQWQRDMTEKLLKLRDVEVATGLSIPTLYRRLREQRLYGIKIDNGSWRIPASEVAKILSGYPFTGSETPVSKCRPKED